MPLSLTDGIVLFNRWPGSAPGELGYVPIGVSLQKKKSRVHVHSTDLTHATDVHVLQILRLAARVVTLHRHPIEPKVAESRMSDTKLREREIRPNFKGSSALTTHTVYAWVGMQGMQPVF